MRQTTVDNLKDLIIVLGGTPKGSTQAELMDELETIAPNIAASEDVLEETLESYLETHTGGLTDEDMDEIFGAM